MLYGVAIDNNILNLYFGMNKHQSKWALNNRYAEILINDLRKKKIPIYLPAPVVTESLCIFEDKNKRNEIFKKLQKDYRILPFDTNAANICAGILLDHDNLHQLRDADNPRKLIKTDAMILAICKSWGVPKIYTNDKSMLKMQVNQLEICPLPKANVQIPLFPEEEAK